MGTDSSQLNILGTVELDIAFKGIRPKQLFYIFDNLKQSALLGADFLRDNGTSLQVHRVSLVETVTIKPDPKILEPMDKFFERFPIGVPSTLSLVNEESVPVHFYN